MISLYEESMVEREDDLMVPEEVLGLDKLLVGLLAKYGEAESIPIKVAPDRQGVASRLVLARSLPSREPSSSVDIQISTDVLPGYSCSTLAKMNPEEKLQVIANKEIFMAVGIGERTQKTLLLKAKRVRDLGIRERMEVVILPGVKNSSADKKAGTLPLTLEDFLWFERLALNLSQVLLSSTSSPE